MEVIDLSNSSQQTKVATRKRKHSVGRRHTQEATTRHVDSEDIIALSDSELLLDDEDAVQVVTSLKTTVRRSTKIQKEDAASRHSTPDPSSSTNTLPSDAQAPRAADAVQAERSSQPRQDKGQRLVGNGPLFYPGSDDDRTEQTRSPGSPSPPAASQRPGTVPPTLPHPPKPPPPVDPMDDYVARVTEIVPDVQPAHVLNLVERTMQTNPDAVVELVLHALFEEPSYPKIDRKGKRKRDEAEEEDGQEGWRYSRGTPKPRVDYLSEDREYDGGPFYFELSLEQLMVDYPRIPKPHIRKQLLEHRFYARAFFKLSRDLEQKPPPFRLKLINSVVSRKGKLKEDPVFENEREWVRKKVTQVAVSRDEALAEEINEQEYQETEDGIECGCCFSLYPFDNMIQCPDAHLFCKSCMTSYSSTLLGEHNPNIVCMDQSGCKLPIPESELKRFLSSKMLELFERVKQRKEIEAAGLENLEECPFCEYKCVIDNEMEKLFRCENAECGAVTCRACKKLDHLPKSCKEVEEDSHLDVQHLVEEAMTRALMRNCPKCQKAFIKELGCNKMTCPNCHTQSCYICRQIVNGYEHFNRPGQGGNKSKCILWDPSVEQRHAEEVNAAAKQAMEELKKNNPDVDASAIKVDLATAGPGPSSRLPNQPVHPNPYIHIYNHNHNHNHVHVHGQNRHVHHFGGPVPAPQAPHPMPYRLPPHFAPPIPLAAPIPPMGVGQAAGYGQPAALAPALGPLPVLQMEPNQMAPNQGYYVPPNPPYPGVPQQLFQMGNVQGQVGMPALAQHLGVHVCV
ncbi:hypothetical protein BKA82DRAFT_4204623 [Pisolithus tinctorius]|nr:hypothetical protein BKA82DRAFT_4204623 [Pisolithus tinctorius]